MLYMLPVPLLACAALTLAQSEEPAFRADVTLQSIAVQVTDKQGQAVRGLAEANFTLLEDGRPQKIAFFGGENQPISLLVLLDSSSSMKSSRKLAGAWALLGPLTHANLPEDEIWVAPFTDRVGAIERLPAAGRATPPAVNTISMGGGTAFYDALATGLCQMRSARNVRQAIVAITDGSDQHSRLHMEQLIQLAQASKPQIFMIGFFDPLEYSTYRDSDKTVTLVSGRDIDNPLRLFERVARETGAESFFPKSDKDLKDVIAHILGVLQTQYTLAYYPRDIGKFRRIQVKVSRRDALVTARRSAGLEGTNREPVHFTAGSCSVSPADHPYPWEAHVTGSSARAMIYQEDYSDPRSGWPNRPGSRYVPGGYEFRLGDGAPSNYSLPQNSTGGYTGEAIPMPAQTSGSGRSAAGDSILAAYGPFWRNFRASLSVEGIGEAARGMVFRLADEGCYMLLISGTDKSGDVSFKLVRRTFWNHVEKPLIPLTRIAGPALAPGTSARTSNRIGVECTGDRIAVLLNGAEVGAVNDPIYQDGYVGLAQFGYGRTLFRDLRVEGLP